MNFRNGVADYQSRAFGQSVIRAGSPPRGPESQVYCLVTWIAYNGIGLAII
jgi:hypothetical protein